MYVRVRASHTLTPHGENPFDELYDRQEQLVSDMIELIKDFLPVNELNLMSVCKDIQDNRGQVYSVEQLKSILEDLTDKGYLIKEKGLLVKYRLNE